MSYILMLGASSDIAAAVAREYARHGYDLYLAARKTDELAAFSNDIKIRYGKEARPVYFDALDYKSHQDFYAALNPKPAGVICAVGYLGDQEKAQSDFAETDKIIQTNYTGCVSILNVIANDFEQRKSGFIVGISSVAGDRGRKKNYMYGSAKAAFTAYLSGLRNRLYDAGVQVLTVKPGFVDTKMIKGMETPEKLTAQPEEVARDIYRAQSTGKDVLYTTWVWRYIMSIINSIPEGVFKKKTI
jgi:decaprenylphospho-beta-D-erythro-pentofuranosid-2-ulose 2-reductase